jgi:chaperonin cofactor prefoldin
MPDKQSSHSHPDSEQRIKALEEQVKKLQQEVRDLQQKMQTHDHPHSH